MVDNNVLKTTFTITIKSARDLAAADLNGKSDPYVKVIAAGQTYGQSTPIIKKTLNPTWNCKLDPLPLSQHEVHIEVWDNNSIMQDKFLGEFRYMPKLVGDGKEQEFTVTLSPNHELKSESVKRVSGTLTFSVEFSAPVQLDGKIWRMDGVRDKTRPTDAVEYTNTWGGIATSTIGDGLLSFSFSRFFREVEGHFYEAKENEVVLTFEYEDVNKRYGQMRGEGKELGAKYWIDNVEYDKTGKGLLMKIGEAFTPEHTSELDADWTYGKWGLRQITDPSREKFI